MMGEATCYCDEMMAKSFHDPKKEDYRMNVAITFNCPKHGRVEVDFRTVQHDHHAPPRPRTDFKIPGDASFKIRG